MGVDFCVFGIVVLIDLGLVFDVSDMFGELYFYCFWGGVFDLFLCFGDFGMLICVVDIVLMGDEVFFVDDVINVFLIFYCVEEIGGIVMFLRMGDFVVGLIFDFIF